jgi:hypothetical protein
MPFGTFCFLRWIVDGDSVSVSATDEGRGYVDRFMLARFGSSGRSRSRLGWPAFRLPHSQFRIRPRGARSPTPGRRSPQRRAGP